MLRVEDVSKRFGGVQALSNVSLDVDTGDVLGLMGPNGAGKTTLFNVISGALSPDVGRVLVNQHEVSKSTAAQMCRRKVARTFQIPKPFGALSVHANVTVGALARQRSVSHARDFAHACLELVGLDSRSADLAGILPLGQLKRLELARSLATGPDLLLLDEICGGLDPTETAELIEVVRRIHGAGTSIIIVEHNLPVIMQLSTKVVVLDFGKIIAEGLPGDIVSNPEVIRSYLGK